MQGVRYVFLACSVIASLTQGIARAAPDSELDVVDAQPLEESLRESIGRNVEMLIAEGREYEIVETFARYVIEWRANETSEDLERRAKFFLLEYLKQKNLPFETALALMQEISPWRGLLQKECFEEFTEFFARNHQLGSRGVLDFILGKLMPWKAADGAEVGSAAQGSAISEEVRSGHLSPHRVARVFGSLLAAQKEPRGPRNDWLPDASHILHAFMMVRESNVEVESATEHIYSIVRGDYTARHHVLLALDAGRKDAGANGDIDNGMLQVIEYFKFEGPDFLGALRLVKKNENFQQYYREYATEILESQKDSVRSQNVSCSLLGKKLEKLKKAKEAIRKRRG